MISEVYAMAPRPGGGEGGGGGAMSSFIVPILFMFLIFYFLMIRPQKKRELAHRKYLDGLQKGDEVVTQAGIYGRISSVVDQVVTLEVADRVKIKVSRASIAGAQAAPNGGQK